VWTARTPKQGLAQAQSDSTGPIKALIWNMPLNLFATLATLAFGVGLSAWAAWQERRPRGLGELPIIPPIPVLIVGVVIVLISLAHLVTLWTGVPLKSRFLP
jgi:hypothetical protein